TALRDAAVWLGVIAVIALGYTYRFQLAEVWADVRGELIPYTAMPKRDLSVALHAAVDGHYYVDAEVEDRVIRFMIDTGASDVVLNAADAKLLGLDRSRLAFSRVYRTANGEILGAPVMLGLVRIGPVEVRNVSASVSEAKMGPSLLGMSFLGR